MLLLVCFRCIQVLTPEEIHHCLPSEDNDDGNDWLLIDYEPVRFNRDLPKPSRDANLQARGGDFNMFPNNRLASMNNYFRSFAPNRYANSSAECNSLLARDRQTRTGTSDEFHNFLGQNGSLSEPNSYFQSVTFANPTFNERHDNENVIRTPDSNIFLCSNNFYPDFNRYSNVKEVLSSANQTARGFNSGDLENNSYQTSSSNHHVESDILNLKMQKNTQEKRNISSTPLYNKRSKPSTSGYIPKYSERTNPVPRREVISFQPLSGHETGNNIPSENMPEKDKRSHTEE